MTDERTTDTGDWIDAIMERLARRTPGEWIKALGSHNNFVVRQESRELLATITSRPDADLIAHAPADLQRCLDRIRELESKQAAHQQELTEVVSDRERRAGMEERIRELERQQGILRGALDRIWPHYHRSLHGSPPGVDLCLDGGCPLVRAALRLGE